MRDGGTGERRHGALGSLLVSAVAAALLLAGCTRLPVSAPGGEVSARTGPAVEVEEGAVPSATGCELTFSHYRPAVRVTQGQVVLGHGFMRDRATMAGLATALAGAGIATTTLDFCNMGLLDGGHRHNGRDMMAVAGAVAARPVVYAGFSAGALAAVLAAAEDPHAAGVVALDLVEAGGLGRAAAATLDVPVVGLVGEASSCNGRNNGLAVLTAAPGPPPRAIIGAGHCEFESPGDPLCSVMCSGAPAEAREDLRRRVVREAVAAAEGLLAGRATVRGEGEAAP